MDKHKLLYYLMMGFEAISFITLPGGNILLGIATFFFFIYIYKNRVNLEIAPEIMKLGSFIGFFC